MPALAVAVLRHQDGLRCPSRRFRAAMGWADWPARLQRLAPGPLVGTAKSGSMAATIRRPRARSLPSPGASSHDGKPLHLIFASLATKDPRGMLAPFKGSPRRFTRCRSRTMPASRPMPLPDRSKLGIPAHAHDDVAEALAAIPDDARVLIFGSLYLAGAVLAPTSRCPTRLGLHGSIDRRRRVASFCPTARLARRRATIRAARTLPRAGPPRRSSGTPAG